MEPDEQEECYVSTDSSPAKGTRRIDRVLAEDFLSDIRSVELSELRELRGEAEQEEVDLSYIRRMVQGRLDILRAEIRRRRGDADSADLVSSLSHILADEGTSASPHGLGRHISAEPSRVDSHRRHVEALVADVDLSDVAARSSDELAHAMRTLSEEEQTLSGKRRQVQTVMDAVSAEITRRYRDGEADVDTLLGESS